MEENEMCMNMIENGGLRKLLQMSDAKYANANIGKKIDYRIVLFRSDQTPQNTIELDGFIPSAYRGTKEDVLLRAKELVNSILAIKEQDVSSFIMSWKHSAFRSKEFEEKYNIWNGRMPGVCCSASGGQKGSPEYKIAIPEDVNLYLLDVKMQKGKIGRIAIYGDQMDLNNCERLAMHLILNETAEEFVFLTTVPPKWIEKVN